MRITYSPRAIADLKAISAYLRPRSRQGAQSVRSAIRRTIEQLEHFPKAGTPQRAANLRKLVTRRYPYLIYYAVDELAGEVIVVTIQHAAKRREHDDA